MKPMRNDEFATFKVKVDIRVYAMLLAYFKRAELKSMQRKETYDTMQHRHLFNDAILNMRCGTKIMPLGKKTATITVWIERTAEEALDYMIRRNLYGTTSLDAIMNAAIAHWIHNRVKRDMGNEN